MTPRERAAAALDRVGKWRSLLTGWQLGTRAKGDPEGDAVRDHREVTLMLRVEVSALAAALISKGVLTQDEWYEHLRVEADELNLTLEARFPGVQASAEGLHLDHRVLAWMSGWRP